MIRSSGKRLSKKITLKQGDEITISSRFRYEGLHHEACHNACVFTILLAGSLDHSNAQTFSSNYTSTAPKDCHAVGKPTNLNHF
ncbi:MULTISPECIES: hypothetical protein [Bradyrhizobium]|uniref:hypothetical protein n=1 Tax=Bradyrhizobium elkanii TaxID=29448 RepID=UPI000486C050|nr:hypothetical protein [Bradyrhizobium elkanii]